MGSESSDDLPPGGEKNVQAFLTTMICRACKLVEILAQPGYAEGKSEEAEEVRSVGVGGPVAIHPVLVAACDSEFERAVAASGRGRGRGFPGGRTNFASRAKNRGAPKGRRHVTVIEVDNYVVVTFYADTHPRQAWTWVPHVPPNRLGFTGTRPRRFRLSPPPLPPPPSPRRPLPERTTPRAVA